MFRKTKFSQRIVGQKKKLVFSFPLRPSVVF